MDVRLSSHAYEHVQKRSNAFKRGKDENLETLKCNFRPGVNFVKETSIKKTK